MDDIIKLNVGGQVFATTRATLCREAGSMLARKFDPESNFQPPKELDGGVFLDRDPKIFSYVLSYLRNGCRVVSDIPDEFLKELHADADYFGLDGLKRYCDEPPPRARSKKEYRAIKFCSDDDGMELLTKGLENGWRIEDKFEREKTSHLGTGKQYYTILSRSSSGNH
jgi:hypothetical protein